MTDLVPTPYPELNGVLRELTEGLETTLADNLLSACLQGSFAIGDFDEHSDVDFIVAVRKTLDDDTVLRLQEMHARIYDLPCRWAQHLEGSYFPAGVLRSCSCRGEDLWYLVNGARSLIRSHHCNTAVVRQAVREHGVTLTGSPPGTLIDPIPAELLREEILATMTDWGREIREHPDVYRNRFYQGFIALNYCRMWCDRTTGTVGSKKRGAEWAKARLDPSWHDLIDRAWATRPDPATSVRQAADPDDYARTIELMDLLIEKGRWASV